MVIDCHNHPDWYGYNVQRLIANMDQNGISRTWVLTWECPDDEYSPDTLALCPGGLNGPIPLSSALTYVEKHPDRFTLGYAPDPRRPEAIDRLASAISLYGVRVYGELKLRMMYDNPDALRMFRFCAQKGLPVLLHIDYEFETGSRYPRPSWWYGGGIEALERALAACPETTFIGHGPGFWAHISGDDQHNRQAYPKGKVVDGGKLVELLRKHPNLYCDLSAESGYNALNRDPDFAKRFLSEFQDRVLFGRDFFDSRLLELLRSLSLPEDTLHKVLHANAVRLVPN
ncbi:MAG: amidohydrolase family protein [Armatimonadota bacterium]